MNGVAYGATVTRRRMRKVVWPAFGVLMLGLCAATTYFVASTAIHAGLVPDTLAAAGWSVAFGLGWRTFSRSHGGVPVASMREVPGWVNGWGLPIAAAASTVLANSFGDTVQMIGIAPVCGFMWQPFSG